MSESGNSLDDESVRILQDTVRTVRKTSVIPALPGDVRSATGAPINWQQGVNGSGATIPAWSCVAVGAITQSDCYRASLTKPAGTSGVQYGLTGPADCAATGPNGSPKLCSFHLEAGWATYTGSVNPGDTVGPTSGSWSLSTGGTGFTVVRVVDASRNIALVMRASAQQKDIQWKNMNSSSNCPAGGLFRITGIDMSTGTPVLTGDQANNTFTRLWGVNGSSIAIASGAAVTGYVAGAVTFAYDTGTPTLGDGFGPKPGQWTASKNQPNLLSVYGIVDGTAKTAFGLIQTLDIFFGKTSGYIGRQSSGTVNIWAGNAGSETLQGSTWTVTAFNQTPTAITSGREVVVEWIDGQWYITSSEGCGLLAKVNNGGSAISKGSSGNVTIYAGTPGSETSTGQTISAFNRFATVADGKWVYLQHDGDGYYLVSAECP